MCLIAGCAASPHILGAVPDSSRLTSIAARQAPARSSAQQSVTLRGTMIEKCPVAACWFRLRDKTGTVKVDVKGAYFTVTEIPTGAEVTVSGTFQKSGDESVFAATGLRY